MPATISIVERLRSYTQKGPALGPGAHSLMREAADEIEALRRDLVTAYLLVAKDADDAPGRISTAIRPFLAAAVIERHGLDIGQNLDSAQTNPSLGGRGNPGGDLVRSEGGAGSIPASATPPSGSPNGSRSAGP